MKTVTAVAAATAAVYAVLAAAEECDYAVVGPTLHTLGDPLTDCMSATGYNVANYSAVATEEQKEAVCSDCTSLIDALNAMTWPDCTMEMGGVDQTLTAYFGGIIGGCSTAGSQYTSSDAVATPTTTTDGSASAAGSSATVGSSDDATAATSAPSDGAPAATSAPSAGATAETSAPSASSSGSASDGAVTVTVSAVALVASAIAAVAL